MTDHRQYEEFARQGFRRIPLVRTLPRETHTPLSVYRALGTGKNSCLLESVEKDGSWGRYSIIGLPARTVLEVRDGNLRVLDADGAVQETLSAVDPFAAVEEFRQRMNAPSIAELPAFYGGLVGYFAYDALRYVEPRLAASAPAAHPLQTPDVLLVVVEEAAVLDAVEENLKLVVHADPREENAWQRARQRLDALEEQLRRPLPEEAPLEMHFAASDHAIEEEAVCTSGYETYVAGVEKVREYILAGDVMQVVPSRRMSLPFAAAPFDFYRALRELNPSPYMYFLDFGEFYVIGSSPEILVRLRGEQLSTRPIAGTRRRGHDPAEDLAMERELLSDPKELAEHLMLIDLGRNDLGRVAQIGSVRATEKMAVERYSHVMHIVSTVTGGIREGLGAVDALRATLPAGTLSGAPKIRAMEIIDELEPVRRSMYGGAVGYLSLHGNMDMAVAIRTVLLRDQTLYIQAGGGIVADSDPDLEWKETCNKARVMLRAAAVARKVETRT